MTRLEVVLVAGAAVGWMAVRLRSAWMLIKAVHCHDYREDALEPGGLRCWCGARPPELDPAPGRGEPAAGVPPLLCVQAAVLTDAQRAGLACVVCRKKWPHPRVRVGVLIVPAGDVGGMFACDDCLPPSPGGEAAAAASATADAPAPPPGKEPV